MNADNQDFKYKELTEESIIIFYRVYNKRKAFDNLRK
jgi:hypothetical protein